jgi:hypothetical protein
MIYANYDLDPAEVRIEASTTEIMVGDRLKLKNELVGADGRRKSSSNVKWDVIEGEGQLSRKSGASSDIIPTSPGKVVVRCSYGELAAQIELNVGYIPQLSRIDVQPETLVLMEGQEMEFSAAGRDQFDNAMPIEPVWTVQGDGASIQPLEGGRAVFMAGTYGMYSLEAEANGLKGAASVVVGYSPEVTSIVVTPQTSELQVGEEVQFEAVLYDQHGKPMYRVPQWQLGDSRGSILETEGAKATILANSPGTIEVYAMSGSIVGAASIHISMTNIPFIDETIGFFYKLFNGTGKKR